MTLPYKDKDLSFDVWTRPLWNWVLDLVEDPSLSKHFEWDARQFSKFDGTSFVRFIDEPWTADRFWEIQVRSHAALFIFELNPRLGHL